MYLDDLDMDTNKHLGSIESFQRIAHDLMNKGDLDQALEYYQRSLSLARKINNEFHISSTLLMIGFCYHRKGALDISLEYAQKSSAIMQKLNDNHLRA